MEMWMLQMVVVWLQVYFPDIERAEWLNKVGPAFQIFSCILIEVLCSVVTAVNSSGRRGIFLTVYHYYIVVTGCQCQCWRHSLWMMCYCLDVDSRMTSLYCTDGAAVLAVCGRLCEDVVDQHCRTPGGTESAREAATFQVHWDWPWWPS